MEEKQLELNKIIKKKKIYQLLIIILFIGLVLVALFVYHKEPETCQLDGVVDDTEPHKAFNSKYEAFEGNSVKGSRLKTLIRMTFNYNNSDENRQVSIVLKTKNNEEQNLVTKGKGDSIKKNETIIDTENNYRVKCIYDDNGYVTSINIEE